ncbi:hypothetical protein GLOIN_2v1523116 [Rhizophagus clarus]|uniref:Uncharacterized protein n=1 Tax=Rhizophagus clarus TaxID=94130 RepID=A0A8H3MB29_9GLOM|nr:hypothetical protein GLOIN_2v1523116 [Rhizophagus clarus]
MSDKIKVLDKSKTSDKFEKFLAGRDIILNCLIPGEEVSSLEEATRNRRIENSTSLALHKVGFVVDSINLKKQQHIHSGGISRNGTAR